MRAIVLTALAAALVMVASEANADQWVPVYNTAGQVAFTVNMNATLRRPTLTGGAVRAIWVRNVGDQNQPWFFVTDCQDNVNMFPAAAVPAIWGWFPVPPGSIAYAIETIACR